MPSKSRNGWNRVISRPASRTMRPASAGDASEARRSFSKISTPSKPAAAIAASFSEKSPLIETVAIEVFIGFGPPMGFYGSGPFHGHCYALANADAHCGQRQPAAALPEFQGGGSGDARSRHAERMAERDRSAIRVHVLRVLGDAEFTEHGNALRGEGFIEFDHVEIPRRDAKAGAELLRRRGWAYTHDARRDAGGRAAENAGNRRQAVFSYRNLGSDNQRRGSVIDARGVAGRDR